MDTAIVPAGIGARRDFIGYRDKGLIFRCACGCGGHVMVERAAVEAMTLYRDLHNARLTKAQLLPCFGDGVYITDHEPLGIAGSKQRVGTRVALRATT